MVAKKQNGQRQAAAARTRVGNPAPQERSPARTSDVPLRSHAEHALSAYFASLNGHRPAQLYDLVLREIEEPLFRAVLDYASGNQSQAAMILGINRGTLRKKLRQFGLSA